jgi:hypothetical protein
LIHNLRILCYMFIVIRRCSLTGRDGAIVTTLKYMT